MIRSTIIVLLLQTLISSCYTACVSPNKVYVTDQNAINTVNLLLVANFGSNYEIIDPLSIVDGNYYINVHVLNSDENCQIFAIAIPSANVISSSRNTCTHFQVVNPPLPVVPPNESGSKLGIRIFGITITIKIDITIN